MPEPEKHWKTMSRSQFPWEQEALDFIHEHFPAQDNYRAWANFEFIADDGSINEVDVLVACPQGIFLIEIKSNPGHLWGDAQDWTWHHDGRRKSVENPVILANRKCKRLKSLLSRQKAFKDLPSPYIEPLVFLSHSEMKSHLTGNAAHHVLVRDAEGKATGDTKPGIIGAIRRREAPGLRSFDSPPVNRPLIKGISLAMEQAGIRPSQKSRRVGDFLLEDLIFDSPSGTYQDWQARHVSIESTRRVARLYMVSRQLTGEDRQIVQKAAVREFQLLERLDHPGILKADPPTECEYGPVLFFRRDPEAIRLDHFLHQEGASLPVDQRLDILRQIGEITAYAHGKKVIHRSLSPQSILVSRDKKGLPVVQIFNWQTGARLEDSGTIAPTRMSMTLHAGQLIEDSSLVYIAPEAIAGNADGGTEMDVFSLGALAYLLFTDKPPASSVTELQQKLKASISGGLNLSEAMDGAVNVLVELVRGTANANATDRESVEDFLAGLDLIEDELTRPDDTFVANPLQATKGDTLDGGYVVKKRLGGGTGAVVFLVDLEGEEQVLKVARESHYNSRIKDEFETLQTIQTKVRSRIVVAPFKLLEFGDLLGFTMESAGDKTMARYLKEEGPLDLTYLQRFGDDLLRTIRDLDDAGGIAHRDIKPENMGLRVPGKKQYQLCIFDFSLAKASPEDIKAGTPGYLDPFISERKVKRWDVSSECFSAAMTLHELATGVLPAWGDGKSDPASIPGEVRVQPERFDPDLRDRFTRFFEKALRRDYRERFDHPGEMLKAWNDIFAEIDERKATAHPETADEEGAPSFLLPDLLTPGTQLVLLGLSTRLLNTLDRLNLVHVADLLGFPLRRIYRLPGVGNKTRRELGSLVKAIRERLPDAEIDPAKSIDLASEDEESTPEAFASVDLIARQVSVVGRGKDRHAEQDILQRYLGWNEKDSASEWPSQSDLVEPLGVTRQRIGQVVTAGRDRWKRYPSVTALRDLIHEILRTQAGVITHEELIASVLASRGSTFEEPERSRMASIATRAALETERGLKEPRYQEYRSGGRIFIALSPELKSYAASLGQLADQMAANEPLPSPASVVEALRKVPAPAFPEDVAPPTDQRLCQLAVAASRTAALSSRMEIYPAGISPERAIALTQNAFFGGVLTLDQIRDRVVARLPRAAPLPARPELDAIFEKLGLDLKWQPSAADGRGAYTTPGSDWASLHTSETLSSRLKTRVSPAPPAGSVAPDIAEALAIEDKLRFAAANGSFLAISVPPGSEEQARIEMERRFPIETCDLDRIFIERMQQEARAAGADWQVVLGADGTSPDSPDWNNLQMLVERCLPDITRSLGSPDKTRLVLHPGLLARYDRMDLLSELASGVGRQDGIHGLWLLVPANGQNPLPVMNRKAVPLSNPAQHVRLNRAWLANKHRA